MLTAVRRLAGHPSPAPREVADQSKVRIRAAISLVPVNTERHA